MQKKNECIKCGWQGNDDNKVNIMQPDGMGLLTCPICGCGEFFLELSIDLDFYQMNEFTQAQVLEHAQYVNRGKPCSVLTIKSLNADYALELAIQYLNRRAVLSIRDVEAVLEMIKSGEFLNFYNKMKEEGHPDFI